MTAEEFKENIIPYSQKLFPMIKGILRDDEESRDATQDLMLKLWSRRNDLENCTNISAYIVSMARNYCFDLLKKKRPERISVNNEYKIINLPTGEKSYELKERHEQVRKIIADLPQKYREIIRFRDVDGFTFEEIKEITGFEIPYVRVILSRARMRVKNELEKIYSYENRERKIAKEIL